jgi:hypothetical protein
MIVIAFLLPILSGALLAQLLWPDRKPANLALKLFLGVGLGLGLNSLSYFLYLTFFTGQHWFLAVQAVTLVLLLLLVIAQWRRQMAPAVALPLPGPSRVQSIMLGLSGLVFLISLLSTASYILRRRQGDWDAWMMFNRAARFFYRDQAHWLASFSPQMDPIFHADYPLFLAMNIASGWDTLGSETPRVPMVQSALFAVACAGLMISALASSKSVGQAALGLIILWGTPAVVNEGARELADLPLAYFFLATAVLIYLFVLHRKPGLLVLAGMTAGLAAWVKNEGSVFIIAGALAVVAAFLREQPWRRLASYAAGAAIPLAVVLYFKLFLAPPSDVLSNGPSRSIAQALDPARHLEILRFMGSELLRFGGWRIAAVPIGIIVVLLVYLLLARQPVAEQQKPMLLAAVVLVGIQMLGTYAVYLITPYDLTWHLTYSVERIILQIFPLLAFAILSATQPPESIFASN